MEIGAVIEIISAVLAFVGIVCLAKYISEVFFLPCEILTAIKIFDDESKENADILLHVAKKGIWHGVGRDTCVIMTERYASDAELISLIEKNGLKYYIVK